MTVGGQKAESEFCDCRESGDEEEVDGVWT